MASHSPHVPYDPNELLSPREFHKLLGGRVGFNALYDALRAGRIRHLRIGRKLLIISSELRDWPLRESVGPDDAWGQK